MSSSRKTYTGHASLSTPPCPSSPGSQPRSTTHAILTFMHHGIMEPCCVYSVCVVSPLSPPPPPPPAAARSAGSNPYAAYSLSDMKAPLYSALSRTVHTKSVSSTHLTRGSRQGG